MTIFEQLEQWLSENRDRFNELRIMVKLVECRPTDNPAVYFDIDTETLVARATIWQSLEMNFEAIDIRSGKEVIAENHRASDWVDVFRKLEDFFVRLR